MYMCVHIYIYIYTSMYASFLERDVGLQDQSSLKDLKLFNQKHVKHILNPFACRFRNLTGTGFGLVWSCLGKC